MVQTNVFDYIADIMQGDVSSIVLLILYVSVLVIGTIVSVMIAQRKLLRESKKEISEGFKKLAERLDKEVAHRKDDRRSRRQ